MKLTSIFNQKIIITAMAYVFTFSSILIPVQATTYTYDSSYRLKLINYDQGENVTFCSDNNGNMTSYTTGVIINQIAAGTAYAVALNKHWKVWAWGYNGYGQLGDGTTTEKYLRDLPTKAAAVVSNQELDKVINDPYIDQQWGFYQEEQIDSENQESVGYRIDANVTPAWEKSKGEGVIVAVIDTGIDITHEDLENKIWKNTAETPDNDIDDDGNGYIDDVNGWNFVDETNAVHSPDLTCDEWHGTHIAGIIAAQQGNEKGVSGVAPQAIIMPLQVFKKGTAYISDIIDAINYAKDMGAQIVNCSWDTSSQNQEDLQEAMDESGLLFVCAAGNSNKDIDVSPVYPASLTGDNIITVTSINKTGHLSYFSNYGLISVDVAAPGEEIMSTLPDNSYGQSAGTSQAAAFVSGQAALISSLYPELTPAQIKERIISSSDKLSSLCEKVVTAKLN